MCVVIVSKSLCKYSYVLRMSLECCSMFIKAVIFSFKKSDCVVVFYNSIGRSFNIIFSKHAGDQLTL